MLGERRLAKGFHLSKARRDGQIFNSDPSGPRIPRQRKGNENPQPTFRPTTFILRGIGENAIESMAGGPGPPTNIGDTQETPTAPSFPKIENGPAIWLTQPRKRPHARAATEGLLAHVAAPAPRGDCTWHADATSEYELIGQDLRRCLGRGRDSTPNWPSGDALAWWSKSQSLCPA